MLQVFLAHVFCVCNDLAIVLECFDQPLLSPILVHHCQRMPTSATMWVIVE